MHMPIWAAKFSLHFWRTFYTLRDNVQTGNLAGIYKMPMAAADVMPPATSWEGLKRQADAAFNKGEYIQAVTFYGKAIDTAFKNKTEDSACAKLFANRALTYQRAGEHTNDLSWCCS